MKSICRPFRLRHLARASVLTALLFLLAFPLVAQEDEEFQKWLKQQGSEFDQYLEEQDKEFLEFLKREWKQADLEPAKPLYTKPKLEVQPAVQKEPPRAEAKPVGPPVVPPPPPVVSAKPKAPVPPASPSAEKFTARARLDFFGVPIELRHTPVSARLGSPLSESSIAGFWKSLSESRNEVIVEQALGWKKEMRLNDWGYALLVRRAAGTVFSKNDNEATLLAWFLLMRSGYDARVGFNEGKVYLLLPVTTTVFGLPYFSFGGSSHRYYAVNLESEAWSMPRAVHTYEGNYPGASKLFDFSLAELPRLGNRPVPRKIRFTFSQEIRAISVTVDQVYADFFKLYPQMPFDLYFNAPVSAPVAHDLVEGLAPLVKGRSEVEAVNILLRFVQTAFKYRTDQQSFGREKPLLVDETMFYDASDCEDRAVLFSFLVKRLTGLPVVGVNYPGHMAAAVRFSAEAGGDAVQVGGARYTICDPTFVFADAGKAMPEFARKEPRIIALKTVQ